MMDIQDRDKLCFPQLINGSCQKPTLLQSESLIINILLFISLLTVGLNLLVIISVSHFRKLHTAPNLILLSLAVSDFLAGCMLMLEIYRKTSCWFLGDIICSLFWYMMCYVVATSIGNIVFISVDRYTAVCDPLHYPSRITLPRIKCSVCLCWLCAASSSLLLVKDQLIEPSSGKSCFGECKFVISYISGTIDLILNFIFPITLIIILYMRVFVVAVTQARAMRSHITAVPLQQPGTLKTKKSELKAARTLGVLVLVFLICFCPYYCVSLAGDGLSSPQSAVYAIYLYYFNSCLNPLIYALFYPWFRKSIRFIVTLQILKSGSCEANIL